MADTSDRKPTRRALLTRSAGVAAAVAAGGSAAAVLSSGDPAEAQSLTTLAAPIYLTAPAVTGAWPTPPAGTAAMVIGPSGDKTGSEDATYLNDAMTAGFSVQMLPGNWYLNATVKVQWNLQLRGCGPTTVVNFLGTGDCFRMYNSTVPTGYPYSTQDNQSGGIYDLLIDGSGAGAGSAGIHMGDMLGAELGNVYIRNFTGTGSIGLHLDNTVAWTEKLNARHVQIANCSTCVQIEQTTKSATNSFEYNDLDLVLYWVDGQNGIVVQGGAFMAGCKFRIRGNADGKTSAPGPLWTIQGQSPSSGDYSVVVDSLIDQKVENDASTTSPKTMNFATSGNLVQGCYGGMFFTGSAWTASNSTGSDQFQFTGPVVVTPTTAGNPTDPGLQSIVTPAMPASTATLQNTSGRDVMVLITGGTVTGISINGNATGLTSGPVLLRSLSKIAVTYSGSPSWEWF
jgi:hypothetical protein